MNLRDFFTVSTWWGKIFGACLGYLIAGPVGALFGILIGNVFDIGLVEHFSRPHWSYYAEKRKAIQRMFFEATFSVMGHIAKSDGRVSENEIHMAKILMEEMRLNKEQIKHAQHCYKEGRNSTFNLHSTLKTLKHITQDNPDLIRLFIDVQYRAAKVDGLSQEKLTNLNIILQNLGYAPLNQQNRFYEEFVNFYQNARNQNRQSYSHRPQDNNASRKGSLDQAFALLEVSPTASKQDIKKAYRRLMSRNHPDRLIAKGLPESMIKVANDKTQRIRKAYDEICKYKGW
jgi:DnaJ like chaperone protein